MNAPDERDEAQERLVRICAGLGIRYEDITVESNEGAPDGYGYGAWVTGDDRVEDEGGKE
jgi:hypothetical protein